MPRYSVLYEGPQGRLTQPFEAPSPEALRDHLAAQGLTPLGFQPITEQAAGSSTTTTPTTTGLPVLGRPEDVAQALVPAIAARVLPGPAKLLAPALGLGARVGVGVYNRNPNETRLQRGAREVMRGLPGELTALAIPPAARKLGTAYEAVRGLVRGSPTLPALERTAGAIGAKQAARVLSPAAEREAGQVTQSVAQTIRQQFGPIFRRELGGAPAIRQSLGQVIKQLPGADRDRALLEIHDATGLRLDKLTTEVIQTATRTRPAELLRAAEILGKHGGDPGVAEAVRRQVARGVLSQTFRRALVRPPRTPFPGAFEGGRVLDPAAFTTGLRRARRLLGPDGERLAFGPDGLRELDRLTQRLGGAKLTQELALAGRGKAPQRGVGETLERFIRLRPFGRAFAVGAAHALGLGGFGETAAVLSEESIAEMLGHLGSTPAGLRWIAAGIDLQRRGFPDNVWVPMLSRSVPNVLASLGIGPSRENTSLAFGLGLGAGVPKLLEAGRPLASGSRSVVP